MVADDRQTDGTNQSIEQEDSRRDLMKKIGGVTGGSLATSIAGCTESSEGSDGSDGNEGSDGSDSTADGDSSPEATIQLMAAPDGFMSLAMDHMFKDTDKWSEYFAEHNLNVALDYSWEGAAIFTSGGADFETFGTLEAAQIGSERDIPITSNANLVPQFILIITNEGSDYDPANAGGSQEAVDKIVEDQAQFALGGWGGATATSIVLAMQEGFGYTFVEDPDESDFNITSAEWFAIPKLLDRGDVDAGTNSPEHGMAAFLDENGEHPFATIFQIGEVLEKSGFGVPQMNGWVCAQEMTEKHPKAAEATVQGYYEGLQWVLEDPLGRVKMDQEEHLKQLGAENLDQAKWMVEWGLELSRDNELPMLYEDIELTDEFIEKDTNFLDTAQEAGYVGDTPWKEALEYRQIPQK